MKQQRGFTLIELVVVIVILGILAVYAAPKFINLQTDARAATLDGMSGALKGANSLVYSKAAIAGVEGTDCSDATSACTIAIDNATTPTTVVPVFGYVQGAVADVTAILDIDTTNEWGVAVPDAAVSSADIIIYPQQIAPTTSAKCFLEYTQPSAAGDLPVYDVVSTNC
ncbi:prepilin-type N-terminal cleavage/methylation domain-containing protein [Ferrimonas marina]|uniref:MSHA pilin protein MshA n=1 Tax=Ferrimonas marina TaxID=299255 RepID=A0A1M5Y1B7_9GAMM|nr:prepilin-type N-terminal cleavage/methylation domain-containing protein [Ferrimonas marina]SHI05578.1 MSHA pilin protein MshA [Ferrimonas marina]